MDEALTVEHLAQVLQEPNRPLLTQVLRILGQVCCRAILGDTLQCEANGGMRTKDGSRRRTSGGVFFQLARERATTHERWRLFPRSALPQPQAPALPHAQPQAPTWDEVQVVVNTLPQGEAPVTLTLIGRPDVQVVQACSTSVAFRMQGKEPGPLPKGLPPVPSQGPMTWLVAIALSGTAMSPTGDTTKHDTRTRVAEMYKATGTQPCCGKAHRGKFAGWAIRESWGGITHEGYRWTPRNACFTIPTHSYLQHVKGVALPNNTAEHASRPGVLWGKGSFGTQRSNFPCHRVNTRGQRPATASLLR